MACKDESVKRFNMLNASSKFAICGLPLRVDSYKTCSFGCEYCFANNRKIMEFEKCLQIGDIPKLEKQLNRVLRRGEIRSGNFIDTLLAHGITWHCGGMSDPFQPCESVYHVTSELVKLTKAYGISILFSTKTDNLYGCEIVPELHTFQFSVTNVDNDGIENRVPPTEQRYKLYRELKDAGFRVGIRLQPFIPGISDSRIVEMFHDADHFTIEGLKLVPQNREHVERVLQRTGLLKSDFTQKGLLNLRPEIRLELYKPIIAALEYFAIPYSIADNDMHHISKTRCCCGDALVNRASGFDSTALCYAHGKGYGLEDALNSAEPYRECKVNHLFTSNRQGGCITLEDFYRERFDRKTSPFSPKFLIDEEFIHYDEVCELNHYCKPGKAKKDSLI